jgi:hypothetical protein
VLGGCPGVTIFATYASIRIQWSARSRA